MSLGPGDFSNESAPSGRDLTKVLDTFGDLEDDVPDLELDGEENKKPLDKELVAEAVKRAKTQAKNMKTLLRVLAKRETRKQAWELFANGRTIKQAVEYLEISKVNADKWRAEWGRKQAQKDK